jgi:hypothetical protein
MLRVFGPDDLTTGEHHIGAYQVIASKAQGSDEPTDTTAKSQSGNSGIADRSGRHNISLRTQCRVYISQAGTWLNPSDARKRIDLHAIERREIEQHTAFGRAEPSNMMPSTTDSEFKLVISNHLEHRSDSRTIQGAHDEQGVQVVNPVVDLTPLIVTRRSRKEEFD